MKKTSGQLVAISTQGVNQDILEDLHQPEVIRGAWFDQIDAAERHNDPGTFTALIGREWSSSANIYNLHRVLFTADNGDVARRFLPYSSYDSTRPEDLWDWMEQTTQDTGARLLAIPSTVNISRVSYSNDTGATELVTTWEDPDFDASQSAIYYLRVLEIQ